MADARRKDAIWTYTGRVIRPLDPDPRDIAIEDIAHSLANQCRFTGHTSSFYSVAQHSYLVSDLVPDVLRMEALLHDASEAYLSDIARPVKRSPQIESVYAEAEARLMHAISEAFNLESGFEYFSEIVAADDALLRAEARDLMPDNFPLKGHETGKCELMYEHPILPHDPVKAESLFLDTYDEILVDRLNGK